MKDETGGSSRIRRRAQYGSHREPRPKGAFLRAVLWIGIVGCLLASTIFVTDRSGKAQGSIAVSTVELSADDTEADAKQSGSIFKDSAVDPRLILGTEMPVIYGVDLKEVGPQESEGSSSPAEINFDVIPEDIKMEILRFSTEAQQEYEVGGQGPQILIYHTHTREAYFETDENAYNVGEYQTTDWSRSVFAVGEILKAELEGYGFTVIHDMTDHVPPKQSTAYSRSLKTMLEYQRQYPTLRIFIDLHRDAYGNGYPPPEAGQKDYVTVDGDACARVMCVVGTGENYEGSEKPNYESNYKLAQAFTNEMENICGGLTRPVRVKPGRYNQQVSDMCLLLEVGHNANTLEQAKHSAKLIALALSRVIDVGG